MQTKTRTKARTSLLIRKNQNQPTRYLGVDLHRDSFLVCMREEGEARLQRWSLGQVQEFAGTLRRQDELAVEATGNTRWFCQQVAERVRRVVVVNPHQFRVISESVKKTDRRDAALLAEYLEKDLLPEVRRKSAAESELAQMAQARDQLVKMRTMLKNQLHGLFTSYGVALPKKALASRRQRTALRGRSLSPLADVQRRDGYRRYVRSWRLSANLESDFCVEALAEALRRGRPEMFNTDQGSQFTGEVFTGRGKRHGIRISLDGRGRALVPQGGIPERLWRSVKYEEVYRKEYREPAEAERGLRRYFRHYNHERLHQALGYRTPAEVHAAGALWKTGARETEASTERSCWGSLRG